MENYEKLRYRKNIRNARLAMKSHRIPFSQKTRPEARANSRDRVATLIDRLEIARDVAMIYCRNLLAEITH